MLWWLRCQDSIASVALLPEASIASVTLLPEDCIASVTLLFQASVASVTLLPQDSWQWGRGWGWGGTLKCKQRSIKEEQDIESDTPFVEECGWDWL